MYINKLRLRLLTKISYQTSVLCTNVSIVKIANGDHRTPFSTNLAYSMLQKEYNECTSLVDL